MPALFMESSQTPRQVRARLDADLANGKTVVLSDQDLDNPQVRAELPQLLEDLSRVHRTAVAGPDIPGYRLLGELGRGGMSTVYLARHEQLQRHAAVKIAPRWLGGGERARSMLRKEAQAMASLKHPNIVAIYDILEVDDSFAIAMEWVEGCTLAGLLRALSDLSQSSGPADELERIREALASSDAERNLFEPNVTHFFVKLVRDIALAAQAVHDGGMLHLDIKPSNVLVRSDATPLLADFGVTRAIQPSDDQTLTFAGTPVYSAPEQLRRSDQSIGPAADVYSLGMTLYEAIARVQPLAGESLASILTRVEAGNLPALSEHAPISRDLESVVHRAIAPEIENRYASAGELAGELQAWLDGRPVQARPLGVVQRLRRWMRNEPWRAGLAAALLLLLPALAALGLYVANRMNDLQTVEDAALTDETNRIRLEACLNWFIGRQDAASAMASLDKAVAVDPTQASLATMFALASEAGHDAVAALRPAHAAAISGSAALRICLDKLVEKRSFFTADELSKLCESNDDFASYIVALDRLFRAEDRGHARAYREAALAFDRAANLRPDDPLLAAMRVWTLLRSGEPDRAHENIRAIRRRWPKDIATLAWTAIAVEQFDASTTEEIAEHMIATAPRDARGYEVLAGMRRRLGQVKSMQEVRDRAAAAGANIDRLASMQTYGAALAGDREAAQSYRASGAATRMRALRHLRIRWAEAPELACDLVDKILAEDDPPARSLEDAYTFCSAHADHNGMRRRREASWQRYRQRHPDRRSLHERQFGVAVQTKNLELQTELARELTVRRVAADKQIPFMIRALLAVRDWHHVRRHAERWLAVGSSEYKQEAAFYVAMASSRLDDFPLAAERMALALHGTVEQKAWYPKALLEDAWLHAAARVPDSLRAPEIASVRLAEFERRNASSGRPQVGPWTSHVRAIVAHADKDYIAARKAVGRGLQFHKAEPHAPADWRERIEALRDLLPHQ
ncbi:MAG: protein kinase [Planctomycetota bacterium]